MSPRSTPLAVSIALAAGLALAACGGSGGGGDTPSEPRAEPASEPAAGDGGAHVAGGAHAETEVQAGDARTDKRDRCVRAIEHVLALIAERGTELSDEQRREALGEGVDDCAAGATRAELDCVLAAGGLDEVRTCEGGGR